MKTLFLLLLLVSCAAVTTKSEQDERHIPKFEHAGSVRN